MALGLPERIKQYTRSKHLQIEKLPSFALMASVCIVLLGTVGIAWFLYIHAYEPYVQDSVPEERIIQTQEKLNVKDFEKVTSAFEEKQKPGEPAANPF